jgi:hypothetical protein
MPRGIPKNKIKNIMKINLDNTNELENASIISAVKKVDEPIAAVIEIKKDDVEYTTSPDGKYKIPKPKKHADFLDKSPSRIPYITDPEVLGSYHIFWENDERPHNISDRINEGYEFVDLNTKGCEHAIPTHSGYRPDGSAYMSYAMWMSLEKFRTIQAMKQNAITEKEQEILRKPSEDSAIYATEQMKLGGAAGRVSVSR